MKFVACCGQAMVTATEVISFNSAISACEKGGQWLRALNVLCCGLPFAFLRPSDPGLHCGEHGRLQAIESIEQLRSFCSQKATSELIKTACQYSMSFGFSLHPSFLDSKVISFNSAISACEVCGCWQAALKVLDVMPRAELTPTAVSCSSAISACDKGERWRLSAIQLKFNAYIVTGKWAEYYKQMCAFCTVLAGFEDARQR